MSSPLQEVADLKVGQLAALVRAVGGPDAARLVLRREKTVSLVEPPGKLFSDIGHRVVSGNIKNPTATPLPGVGYYRHNSTGPMQTAWENLRHFSPNCHLSRTNGMDYLIEQTEILISQLKTNRRLRGLTKAAEDSGVSDCLPIILPPITNHLDASYNDIFHRVFLPAAKTSYRQWQSERLFRDMLFELTPGLNTAAQYARFTIMPNSHHEMLIERMKTGPVVGLFFPNALLGFSVAAAREQMTELPEMPEGLLLAGGLDTLMALIAYPHIIGRTDNDNRYGSAYLHMPAIQVQWSDGKPSLDLYLHADKNQIALGISVPGQDPLDCKHCTSGLLFIGQG